MNPCFCFSRETGGLVIGVLEVIGGIIGLLLSVLSLGVFTAVGKELEKKDSKIFPTSATGEDALNEVGRDTAQLGISVLNIIVIFYLIISCIQIIISSLLIHGIRKKSITLMTVWTIFKIIFIILLVVFFVWSCFTGITFLGILFYILLIGLSAFYVSVIHELKMHSNLESDGLPSYVSSQNKL
jgi:hypothetical protein